MAATPARPRWQLGQILRPEHFLGLEEALSAEAIVHASCLGLPSYGLIDLVWNGDDPVGGALFIEALTAVFPSGAVIDVPGNASVLAPLQLASVGRDEVDVHIHLRDPPESPGEEEEDPLSDAPPPPEIPRREREIVLSASAAMLGSKDHLTIGRFRLGISGKFQLAEDFLPPLLRVDPSSVLVRRLTQVRRELEELDRKLDALAADARGQDRPLGSIVRVRIESRKLEALLAELGRGVRLHPYWVFSALRAFAAELSLLDETKPLGKLPPYDHDNAWPGFSTVFGDIERRVEWSPASSPRVQFVPEGGHLVARLPDAVFSASEIWVVVQKRDEGDQVPFEAARLASPRRLALVREYAICGVPFHRDDASKMRHAFGPTADFYKLDTTPGSAQGGREWDHVVSERAIAFRPTPDLSSLRFVLCWRRA